MEASQLQNGDDSWYSGSSASARQRAKKLRKHAMEMARAVQALLQMAEEIEIEEDSFEAKRKRKDAASGRDVSKEIFKTTSESLASTEKRDDSVSCKHQ